MAYNRYSLSQNMWNLWDSATNIIISIINGLSRIFYISRASESHPSANNKMNPLSNGATKNDPPMNDSPVDKSRMPVGPHFHLLTKKIALDCEMVNANIVHILGRVSVVNYAGQTIYDTFVSYPDPVVIKNTLKKHSGIVWADVDPPNGAQTFSKVQEHLIELFKGRILIGHAIHGDLRVISMDLNSCIQSLMGITVPPSPVVFDVEVRDTQQYSEYRQYAIPGTGHDKLVPSLKNVSLNVLSRAIKEGTISSVEDTVATIEIYRHAEMNIDGEQNGRTFA